MTTGTQDTYATITLIWGMNEQHTRNEVRLSSIDELNAILDGIHAEAVERDLPQMVETWGGPWAIGDPGDVDPVIQVMLGHPTRASCAWLGAQDGYRAVDPALPPLPEPIDYDYGGATDPMDPEGARITPDTARRILTAFFTTGSRPTDVTWNTLYPIA